MRSIRSKQKIKNVGHYIRRKEVKGMTVNFGDVMMIDFGKDKINSVQVGVRPGVIIQNDIGNKYSPTSIAVPLTSEIKKLNMPCHKVLHMNEQNGLTEDSMVLGEQVRVIDKNSILYKMGTLNDGECDLVVKAYFANVPRRRVSCG
jgi:mRNA interferase MazF